MLVFIWIVLCVLGVGLLLLPLALWLREVYRQYSGERVVSCPENQQAATVNIDARHAVATGIDGRPILRLCDCTRWPEHAQCDRACLSQAARSEPYSQGKWKPETKPIHHLPILLGAFGAWYVGAIWHSQYVFRARWMEAVGLTQSEVKQIVWWLSPHLLTFAACLLFAYGVGWLLAVRHRKGVLQGLLMSVALGGGVLAASWYAIAELPRELIVMEVGYAALVTITVGAIVGGLYDKIRVPAE